MKLHLISKGYAVPLGYQAKLRGCAVTAHIAGVKTGEGIIPLIPAEKPTGACDAVLMDGTGWGRLASELVKDGHRVLFGGAWAELMGLNESYNKAVLVKAGVTMAEKQTEPYTLLVGGWHEHGYNAPFYAGILRHRLLAGDLGAVSGLVAAEIAPIHEEHPLVEQFLEPVGGVLDKVEYRGLLSVVLTATPDGLAATHIMAGAHPLVIEALSEMMYDGLPGLIEREGSGNGEDCAIALSLSLPPWPYGAARTEPPLVFEIDDGQAKHFWPLDVRAGEDGSLEYSGSFGIIGTVTGRGRPESDVIANQAWFSQAGHRVRALAARIPIEDLQYRNDIGFGSAKAMALLGL